MWSSEWLCNSKCHLTNNSILLVSKQGLASTKPFLSTVSWITFLKTLQSSLFLKFWRAFGSFSKISFYLVILHEAGGRVMKKKAWDYAVWDCRVLTLAHLHHLLFYLSCFLQLGPKGPGESFAKTKQTNNYMAIMKIEHQDNVLTIKNQRLYKCWDHSAPNWCNYKL